MSGSLLADAPTADRNVIDNQLDYENQYVSFWVDGQLLGVPVNAVQEVLNPQIIAPTPLARAEIAGLLFCLLRSYHFLMTLYQYC